jgi:hypothetical protein
MFAMVTLPIASAEGSRFPSYCCYGDFPPIVKHMILGLHVFKVMRTVGGTPSTACENWKTI